MNTTTCDGPGGLGGQAVDDPICGICGAPMEPVPPVGWICCFGLTGHQDAAAALGLAAA
jgi:hypothetical protein